ncbi:hypothetical protein EMCRGX_G025708 [Ephydatia muelleri]
MVAVAGELCKRLGCYITTLHLWGVDLLPRVGGVYVTNSRNHCKFVVLRFPKCQMCTCQPQVHITSFCVHQTSATLGSHI